MMVPTTFSRCLLPVVLVTGVILGSVNANHNDGCTYGEVNDTAFIVCLFILLPTLMCVYSCSCCTFCSAAWLVTCIHRWGSRWRRNRNPRIVEVAVDPQQQHVGVPRNMIGPPTTAPLPLDGGVELPPSYSLAAPSPSTPPPSATGPPVKSSVYPPQEQVGDIGHKKED